MRVGIWIAVGLSSLIGCSSPVPPEPATNEKENATPQALSVSNVAPGFRHELGRSRFALGSTLAEEHGSTHSRVLGANGAVFTRPNGYFAARRHSFVKRPPPMTNAAEQHSRVLAYFKGAGLPDAQIGKTESTTVVQTTGSTSTHESTRELVTHTSIITRVVAGVLVAESHAWAELDKDGNVVAEDVWWPEISASVIEAVAKLRAVLDDPSRAAAYADALPGSAKGQKSALVIHHSLPSLPLEAQATVDVMIGNEPHSFDINGLDVSHVAADRSPIVTSSK